MLIFILACLADENKALPKSRLPPKVESKMVQYGELELYLLMGQPPFDRLVLIKGNPYDKELHECAQATHTQNDIVAVTLNEDAVLESYLQTITHLESKPSVEVYGCLP